MHCICMLEITIKERNEIPHFPLLHSTRFVAQRLKHQPRGAKAMGSSPTIILELFSQNLFTCTYMFEYSHYLLQVEGGAWLHNAQQA